MNVCLFNLRDEKDTNKFHIIGVISIYIINGTFCGMVGYYMFMDSKLFARVIFL